MSNLRGDILGSSASRLNTLLHLGEVKPGIASLTLLESKPTLPIAMVTSVFISLVTFTYTRLALGEPISLDEMIAIAFLSSLLATVTLLPYIAFLASETYRRGWDPGNLLPTIVTSSGDLVTLPFLVIALLVVLWIPHLLLPMFSLLVASASIAVYAASLAVGEARVKRILRERLLVLALVMVTHPLTGAILASLEEGLAEMGLIHLATTFIGVNGALAAIAGVRLSSAIHLYGLEGLGRRYVAIVTEILLASTPAVILVAAAGYTAQSLIPGVVGHSYVWILLVVALATIAHLAVGLIVALAVSLGSFRLGLDPDNVAIPMITNIMDLTGIPIMYAVGLILYN